MCRFRDTLPAMAKTTTKPVRLGNVVVDPVSGVSGTAIALVEMLNGSVRYSVQPKTGKHDKQSVPDAYDIDVHLLDHVGDGMTWRVTPAPEVPIKLGDRVRDKVTGLVGIATTKTTFLNGCVYFIVSAAVTADKPTEVPTAVFIPFARLDVVEPGAFKPTPPVSLADRVLNTVARGEPVSFPPPPTGGPTTRSHRAT